MNKQTIVLTFEKTLTKLTGNRFGAVIYDTQVRGKVDFTNDLVIVFPESIDRIASSFIQGFFSEIMSQIGYSGVKNRIEFRSSISNLKDFVLDNLR